MKREGRPGFAVVVFGDVEGTHDLQSADPALFTEAVAVLNKEIARLLVPVKGYNVPQREGHYLITFNAPADAVRFHVALQTALLQAPWPAGIEKLDKTRTVAAPDGSVLFKGLTVSFGMSVGKISKSLERGRANYLGPTCNRSARVCGLAKRGQLLMCLDEWEAPELAEVREGKGGGTGITASVLFTQKELKGIKGVHDIVGLATDPLTEQRAVGQVKTTRQSKA